MKTKAIHLLILGLLPAAFAGASSAPAGTEVRLDSPSFEIIATNSIFSPGRGIALPPPLPPPPQAERLLLTGTMSYAGKHFAFFDGSNPQWRRVLQPGEVIAGFKLEAVSDSQIRLTDGDDRALTLDLPVEMSRFPGASWQVVDSIKQK